LDFGGGHTLTVPLGASSYLCPEAMHFQSSPTAPVQVWSRSASVAEQPPNRPLQQTNAPRIIV
jgi:hypothetical protein